MEGVRQTLDPAACFNALVQCHVRYSTINDTPVEVPLETEFYSTEKETIDDLRGIPIAKRFSLEAVRALSSDEIDKLLIFLRNPQASMTYSQEQMQAKLMQRLEEFYSMDQQLSHQNCDGLSIPGGPVTADLGIALHLATGRDISRNFWDKRSASISLLQEKGISEQFAFGYDWHWRSEKTYLDRSDCPLKKWPKQLRALHDQMSTDILDMLSLPFLITGSACTRSNLKKSLGHASKRLEVPISPTATLDFDLDFRNDCLRRMIVHICHPSAGFTANSAIRSTMASQIDAGLKFFLWLTGRSYDATSFRRTYSQAGPCRKRSAPLAEMYFYIRKEREERRFLKLTEYSPSFLSWAGRYLFQDPATITSDGNSVAVAALSKIRKQMSISRRKHVLRVESEKIPERKQENGNCKEDIRSIYGQYLFHGKAVVILRSGYVKLTAPEHGFSLLFRMSATEAKKILALQKEIRIYFLPCEVTLCVDDITVYRKPIERLLSSVRGEEWLLQIVGELTAVREGLTEEKRFGYGTPEINLAVIPHDSRLGNRWKNGELQRKLSLGSLFSCTEMSNAAKVGRVYFRGVQLYIPREADFETVFVKCDLVAQGFRHPNACISKFEPDDPANRIGIKVRYQIKESSEQEEFWVAMSGDCNIRILNSLVDFLDGKSEDWTEGQPRRFLPRNISKGRGKISYTS
ncbi:hypothetical protein ASPFODRAFT_27617 [Aspergillus luchuensis CBS 106.47]|uniref:Uncharacterized protein n=1 Tax=Aspergillus luchuensis (strain CBS 106.47) TaxID=1137211 RepID=A0A1M3TY70_ASPLC|nr:hypothetical protein ASPFODRAFT_27617 [Aspergillus luchuensis CBS 106.47]